VTALVVTLVVVALACFAYAQYEALRSPGASRRTVTDVGPAPTQTTPVRSPAAATPSGRHPAGQQSRQREPLPIRVEIPQIGVRTKIMKLGLTADRTVQVPPYDRADEVGWYDESPVPGDIGPSVLIGHIDSPSGPAVFYRLASLGAGDKIRVTRSDGSTAVFRVSRVRTVAKNRFPTRSVYGNLHYPGLRLITCGGQYVASAGGYQANTIVYARLTSMTPGRG
jgi:sortase (surface protein transpeptidase)